MLRTLVSSNSCVSSCHTADVQLTVLVRSSASARCRPELTAAAFELRDAARRVVFDSAEAPVLHRRVECLCSSSEWSLADAPAAASFSSSSSSLSSSSSDRGSSSSVWSSSSSASSSWSSSSSSPRCGLSSRSCLVRWPLVLFAGGTSASSSGRLLGLLLEELLGLEVPPPPPASPPAVGSFARAATSPTSQ